VLAKIVQADETAAAHESKGELWEAALKYEEALSIQEQLVSYLRTVSACGTHLTPIVTL
jgi:hypothetical protein